METEEARTARLVASERGKELYRETVSRAEEDARAAERRVGRMSENRRARRANAKRGMARS